MNIKAWKNKRKNYPKKKGQKNERNEEIKETKRKRK